MAFSTYKTFLMHKASGSDNWTKLIDVKDYPNLGGTPEMLETTTLSDKMQTYTLGVQSLDSMDFTANYSASDYAMLNELAGVDHAYAVWFGATESQGVLTPTGSDGKFEFTAKLSVYPKGGGVNEVVEMGITLAPSTVITFKNA